MIEQTKEHVVKDFEFVMKDEQRKLNAHNGECEAEPKAA